jgi:hypothetical protein
LPLPVLEVCATIAMRLRGRSPSPPPIKDCA